VLGVLACTSLYVLHDLLHSTLKPHLTDAKCFVIVSSVERNLSMYT